MTEFILCLQLKFLNLNWPRKKYIALWFALIDMNGNGAFCFHCVALYIVETFDILGYYYCTSREFYTGTTTANKTYERNRRKDIPVSYPIHTLLRLDHTQYLQPAGLFTN